METVMQVVWWIGLIGALIATLVLLKEVAVILRVLRHIYQLAHLAREAAQGIATNVAAGSRLAAMEEPARGLSQSARALAATSSSLERKLAALAAGRSPDGG